MNGAVKHHPESEPLGIASNVDAIPEIGGVATSRAEEK